MTGFTQREWTEMPWGRGNKSAGKVWRSVKRSSGVAPSLIQYIPPQPSRKQRAKWVIHHQSHRFVFEGSAVEVRDEILRTDLNRPPAVDGSQGVIL